MPQPFFEHKLSNASTRTHWRNAPSLVCVELLSYYLFLSTALAVASLQGRARRDFGVMLFAAFCCAFALDVVQAFREPHMVYHSQALMMIYRRWPVYAAFARAWLLFAPVTVARFFRHAAACAAPAEDAFAALLGGALAAVHDRTGARWLWWALHSSEPLYMHREHDLPVLASLHAALLCGSFSYVTRTLLRRLDAGSGVGGGELARAKACVKAALLAPVGTMALSLGALVGCCTAVTLVRQTNPRHALLHAARCVSRTPSLACERVRRSRQGDLT
jgi:hypothetical protein